MPHEQYLDEPGLVIQWMVRIDAIEQKIAAEQRRAAAEQRMS